MSRDRTIDLIFLLLYVAMTSAIVWQMFDLRQRTIERLENPQSQAQWESWREDVRRGAADGGAVERTPPKSAEPPSLVLLRDHFVMCVAAAVLFSSALFFVMTFFIRGVMRSKSNQPNRASGRLPTKSAGPR